MQTVLNFNIMILIQLFQKFPLKFNYEYILQYPSVH